MNAKNRSLIAAAALLASLSPSLSLAEGAGPAASVPTPVQTPSLQAEKVEMDAIQERYWARGVEEELTVVQNRTYTKKGKLQLSLLGGFTASDPFLNIATAGVGASYHLSEIISFGVLWWRSFVSKSTALDTFETVMGATTNYNAPQHHISAEIIGSLIYGKLSVLGKAIIYYDLHVMGGVGATLTETGTYVTPTAGIGQQIHLTKWLSLRTDYRLGMYNETLLERVIPQKLGQSLGSRLNWSHSVILGFDFLIPLSTPSQAAGAKKP